ncbi:MAG: MraZ protein [Parcubacteria group bacterium Athens0714_26]|nr:MAG: MraZ protein [Parcubacteria group bacterium Athens1014_26]TSD03668.1 MAG: MraZ protein [Parcubacteria group bacterium Athens0714_26]
MFLGEYQHNLDSKGRMAVPAKFRQQLGAGAIITRGLDRCLFVFTMKEWEVLAQKIISLPLTRSDARAFSRLMLAEATDVEVDKQGRVLIPEYLRNYANLKKEAVVTGLYNRFEIWDAESWKQYKSKTESASEDIAEKLGELGI